MYKVIVIGDAKTDCSDLSLLNGIDCQDEFTIYFGGEQQSLRNKGVKHGYMSFKHDIKNNILFTITTYESPEELTEKELEILKKYTIGQWSDGIGEGFEQEPCAYGEDGEEIFISPWHDKQITTITQIKIE